MKKYILLIVIFLFLFSFSAQAFEKGDIIIKGFYNNNGKIKDAFSYLNLWSLSYIKASMELDPSNNGGLGLEYIIDNQNNFELSVAIEYHDYQRITSYSTNSSIFGIELFNVENEHTDLYLQYIPLIAKVKYYLKDNFYAGGMFIIPFVFKKGPDWENISAGGATSLGLNMGFIFADDWILDFDGRLMQIELNRAPLFQPVLQVSIGKKL